jgi:hypothetical protein
MTMDQTKITASWEKILKVKTPAIICCASANSLHGHELKSWQVCFYSMPTGVQVVMKNDFTFLLMFKSRPGHELVALCFRTLFRRMVELGHHNHEERWDLDDLYLHGEGKFFNDVGNLHLARQKFEEDAESHRLSVKNLIRLRDSLIMSVGHGEIDLKSAYASLVLAISALDMD